MSYNKVDSNPAWSAPARQFVPLHLQPGSTRSSFARPDKDALHRPKSISPAAALASSPPQSRVQRSGFASRSKSKLKRSGSLETEDDLPPTLSLRELESQDYDLQDSALTGSVPNSSSLQSNAPSASSKGTPVIVFGFPPGTTQSILQYFGKFGEITENVSGSDKAAPVAAIECGRNWLRITYRERSAAQRALAQNGHLMPGQYVIGCVPAESGEYTSTMQQSSTNSLLLDDSEVSLIQDQSMASVLEGEQTQENIGSGSNNSSQSQSSQSQQPSQQILPEKIVPREMTNQIFRDKSQSTHKNNLHLLDINSTRLPEASKPTSFAGKITNAVTQALFNWDV